jgi:hypothetical protein
MKSTEKKIWFPAKTYGWGWGLPCCWQGWVVMLSFLLLLGGSALLLLPLHPLIWEGVVWFLALLLIAICWIKGERPRWRWGKDD